MLRQHTRFLGLLVLSLSVFALFFSSVAQSATVSDQHTISVFAVVQAPEPPEEPITEIYFQGLAYPDADIVIEQDGVVWLTSVASSDASFFVGQEIDPGSYTFRLTGTDLDGRIGPSLSLSLGITEGSVITVNNIFLGPTIESNRAVVPIGQSVVLDGYTVPNSTVTLSVAADDATFTYSTVANANGVWTYNLVAGDSLPELGPYAIFARARTPSLQESEYSKTISLVVTEGEDPDPCQFANIADLNCDSRVDLVDFSILLFYWLQGNPANIRADINIDGIVNVVDFSIMMFHWTG